MGKETGIEWTDHTFNPWWGCQRVSPGCERCYAETWDRRVGGGHWGPIAPRRFFKDAHWNEPRRWDKTAAANGVRARVFCASMADVFEDRPDLVAPRARLFQLIAETPRLDWLLLTKRPQNLVAMLPWRPDPPGAGDSLSWGKPWPNVWVGTTVEDRRRATERIPVLAQVPAVVRFLSMEPLLEEVDLTPYLWDWSVSADPPPTGAIDWIIAGCESGQDKRPAYAAWFRRLRDQAFKAGVAYFLKQAMPERGPAVYPGTGAFRPELVSIGKGSKVKRDEVVTAPYLDGVQHLAFPTPRLEVAA